MLVGDVLSIVIHVVRAVLQVPKRHLAVAVCWIQLIALQVVVLHQLQELCVLGPDHKVPGRNVVVAELGWPVSGLEPLL